MESSFSLNFRQDLQDWQDVFAGFPEESPQKKSDKSC
jgi:hypothetical protein